MDFSYLKEPNQSIRSQRTRIENLQIRKSTILSKRKAKMVKQFQKYRIHYTGRNVIFNIYLYESRNLRMLYVKFDYFHLHGHKEPNH